LAEKVTRLEYTLQKDKKSANEIDSLPLLKGAVPRTCREARAADPSLSSGMYWIDPDGQGGGDGPIYVYCDMTSGKIMFSAFEITFIRLVFRIDNDSTQQRIANKCWTLR
jgi:hypothetical protein